MEPKPIEPQDIRVGMRVRRTLTHESGLISTDEFTVRAVAGGAIDFDDHAGFAADHSATWTLLADAPEPERPVGSHWRDPETGAEYVATDTPGVVAFYRYRRADDAPRQLNDGCTNAAIIARLTPIPAFDPATLWPRAVVATVCRASTVDHESSRYYQCDRVQDHDGPHVEHVDAEARYVWGDPR